MVRNLVISVDSMVWTGGVGLAMLRLQAGSQALPTGVQAPSAAWGRPGAAQGRLRSFRN